MAVRSLLAMLLAVGFAASSAVADAGPAYLVKDLNPAPVEDSDSDPSGFVVLNGIAYFTAVDGLHGREIWRSDGTFAGTRLFADLNPGEGWSSAIDLTVIGDALWFRAWDGWRGCGLWRSDGTAAGTREVAVIHTSLPTCAVSGDRGGNPTAFTAVGAEVFFAAGTPETGVELWRSDGTAAGTGPVADIRPGWEDGGLRALTALDGALYFVADDGVHGAELWRSDGTEAGTRMVRDINVGQPSGIPAGSLPPQLAVAGGVLLFAADDGVHGVELWRSDGTEDGTLLLVDTNPDEVIGGLRAGIDGTSRFATLGTDVLFFSNQADAHMSHLFAWRSDGSAQGTMPIGEVQPRRTAAAPANLTSVADAAYFSAGVGLWRIDGHGVAPVTTLTGRGEQISGFTPFGDQLLFLAPSGDSSCGLWRSDGTAAGTQLVRGGAPTRGGCPEHPVPGVTYLGVLGARALLAEADVVRGAELFVSDGTTSGTQLLRDVNDSTGRTQRSFIDLSVAGALDDVLLFGAALGDGAQPGLWRSDGTAAGTRLVAPVRVDASGIVDDRFVFNGDDGSGPALWVSDGGDVGTHVLRSLAGSWGISTPAGLFVTVRGDDGAVELWRSDGTTEGTVRVPDRAQAPMFGSLSPAIAYADGLAFVMQHDDRGDLWTSDGTDAGTRFVATFSPPRAHVRDMVDVDGTLYLDVVDLDLHSELWRSDGTAAGTERVVDLGPEGRSLLVQWLAPGPGALFFAAADDPTGLELWRSDGTAAGTNRVRDIRPGSEGALVDPDGFAFERTARVGDALLFVADDGLHGPELWRTDGSAAGTRLLRDIDPRHPAVIEDYVLLLTSLGTAALFAPFDAAAGVEPWVSDGTVAGTRLLADIAPGARSSLQPFTHFAATRTHVFMAADDGTHGDELWAIPRAAIDGGPACAGDCNGDVHVAIDELIRGVGIALGSAPVSVCASFDRDGDGDVSIAELVAAVAAALEGC